MVLGCSEAGESSWHTLSRRPSRSEEPMLNARRPIWKSSFGQRMPGDEVFSRIWRGDALDFEDTGRVVTVQKSTTKCFRKLVLR